MQLIHLWSATRFDLVKLMSGSKRPACKAAHLDATSVRISHSAVCGTQMERHGKTKTATLVRMKPPHSDYTDAKSAGDDACFVKCELTAR